VHIKIVSHTVLRWTDHFENTSKIAMKLRYVGGKLDAFEPCMSLKSGSVLFTGMQCRPVCQLF